METSDADAGEYMWCVSIYGAFKSLVLLIFGYDEDEYCTWKSNGIQKDISKIEK